jgi:hypothetical protein
VDGDGFGERSEAEVDIEMFRSRGADLDWNRDFGKIGLVNLDVIDAVGEPRDLENAVRCGRECF